MTSNDYAFVARVITDLFPQHKPTDEELRLWRDSIIGYPREHAVAAVRQHRTSNSWPNPDLAKVLELCRVKEADRQAAHGDMAAEYAQHAERSRQDMDAARLCIAQADPAVVQRAKFWLSTEAVPSPGQDEVAACSIRHNLLATMLRQRNIAVFLLCDAILMRPWERGEGLESFLVEYAGQG